MSESVTIAAQDGSGSFSAYVARPPQGSGPGIVLIQEIFGVNSFVRRMADRFAEEGYVVYAPDLFWRIRPGIDLNYSPEEWQEAFGLFQAFDADKGTDDIAATIAALRADSGQAGGVGCVGYCLGGKLAMTTAARTDVDCAVSYYGVGLEALVDEVPNISCPILFHFAELDGFAPPESRDAVQAAFAGVSNATFHTYIGQDHAFSRPEGDHYHKPSANMAYGRTVAHFRSTLGPIYDLSALWDKHCEYEFATRDVRATMSTMIAEPYVNHVPTMTGGVGARAPEPLLPTPLRQRESRGHQARAAFAHRRRDVACRRDAVLLHPRSRDRLDASRCCADREVRRDSARRDREIPWRQAVPRTHLLGSGVGAGADRLARPDGVAGRRGRDGPEAGDETLPSNTLMTAWASSAGKPVG